MSFCCCSELRICGSNQQMLSFVCWPVSLIDCSSSTSVSVCFWKWSQRNNNFVCFGGCSKPTVHSSPATETEPLPPQKKPRKLCTKQAAISNHDVINCNVVPLSFTGDSFEDHLKVFQVWPGESATPHLSLLPCFTFNKTQNVIFANNFFEFCPFVYFEWSRHVRTISLFLLEKMNFQRS